VQADAVADAGRRQHLHQTRREEFGIAQLEGVERPLLAQFLRQGGKEGREALDQCRRLFDQAARQWRHLEDQRPRLGAKAFQTRHDEFAGSDGGVEEVRVGHLSPPLVVAHHGITDQRRRLHDEAEMVRHLLCVALVLHRGDRRIERAVEADRAQQRDLRIGRQALLAERDCG
jgi:hypothetical protein